MNQKKQNYWEVSVLLPFYTYLYLNNDKYSVEVNCNEPMFWQTT